MLMNSKTIHSEMMKNDIPGFDDESNKINLDVIQMITLLERCIMIICFILLIQQIGTENTC